MEAFPAPSNPQAQCERPPHTQGEEENVEKKPVLQKVKDKVKKIKNTITNKTSGHGGCSNGDSHHQQGDLDDGDEGYEENEELEQDPAFHGAPIYESSAADARIGAMDMGRGGGNEGVHERTIDAARTGVNEFGGGGTEAVYGRSTSGPRTGHDEIGRGGTGAGYENSAAGARTGESEWGRRENERKGTGLRGFTPELVEDPAAPNSSTGTENKIGGEEVAISPDLGRSVEAMTASSQNGAGKTQLSEDENRSNAGMAWSAKERGGEERAISPELRRSFDAMSVSDQTGGGEPELSQNKTSSYADKISAAKDRAFSVASESAVLGKKAASMAYEKAAGAGSAVMAKVRPEAGKDGGNEVAGAGSEVMAKTKPEAGMDGGDEVAGKQDKGVSMKDYVSGKLSPGEEDKALSQVITEALTPGKGGTANSTSPTSPQKPVSGEGGGALGVVGKIKETVTSFLGGGGSPRATPAAESHLKDESKDFVGKTPEALSHHHVSASGGA